MSLLSPLPRYRIGIDVGENSVGLAAISYDDDDHVIEILSALSYIHDGGKLSGTIIETLWGRCGEAYPQT
jgi:hypothetical protein